jgi:hypothetical protein
LASVDRVGQKFNNVIIIEQFRLNGITYALLKCDCGNLFNAQLGNIVSGGTKSCGCHRAKRMVEFNKTEQKRKDVSLFMKARRGSFTANWKGGITPRIKILRTSDSYKKLRADVFERDNWTCQECGVKGTNDLEVHHIKKVADYPDLMFDMQNCFVLCHKCHMETNNYGKKRPEQTINAK